MKLSSVTLSALLAPCVTASSPTYFPTYERVSATNATDDDADDSYGDDYTEGWETNEPAPTPSQISTEGSPTLEDELSNYFSGGESEWATGSTTSATEPGASGTAGYSSGTEVTTVAATITAATTTTAAVATTVAAEDYNEYDATTVAAGTTAYTEEDATTASATTTMTTVEEEGGEYSYGSEVTVEEIESESYTSTTSTGAPEKEDYGHDEVQPAAATAGGEVSAATLKGSISLFLLGFASSIIYFC